MSFSLGVPDDVTSMATINSWQAKNTIFLILTNILQYKHYFGPFQAQEKRNKLGYFAKKKRKSVFCLNLCGTAYFANKIIFFIRRPSKIKC